MITSKPIGRRPLLGSLMAAGAASALPASARAASPKLLKLDPSKPEDVSLIFRKLAYATDERVGYWWLHGTRYGLIETKLYPLWRMHIGSLFTVRDLGGGAYETTRLSATFYGDLTTGKPLKTFLNPLNNKTIQLQYDPIRPVKVKYDVAGLMDPASGRVAAGVSNGAIGPAWIQGDDVWVQSDHISDVPPTAPGKRPVRVSDIVTYYGSLRDVADPANKMPKAGYAFSDINSWPDWMEMDDKPGDYYSRTIGRKVTSYAEMPEDWRQFVAEAHPELAKDPVGLLRS